MRKMWFLVAIATAPPPARAADPSAAEVDAVMADALKAWGAPGAAVVVVRGGEVVHLKGYGVRHLGQPEAVTPDTLFPLASCTKALTSTLFATLADDGKLGWDDPVRDHLPTFRLADPHADALCTVRDLLSHRTGLGGNDLLWYHAPWGIDEVLKRVDKLPPEYPFRAGFRYTSLTYMAAGRLAARRGGGPWEKLVKERLTDPLGMTGVRFTTADPPADRAAGHKRRKDGTVGPMPPYPMPEPNPAGSVHATARDLGAWVRFHLADGVTPAGRRLVSAANLAETKRPQTIIRLDGSARAMNPDTHQLSYGMGWVVSDHRGKLVHAHGGQIDGHRVQVTLLPDERLGIALLNNLHETRMNQAVTNTLIDRYCGLPPRDWDGFFLKLVADAAAARRAGLADRDRGRDPGVKPTLPPDGYAGEYADPGYGTVTVGVKDGKLQLDWSSFRVPLEHYQGDVYRLTADPFEDQLAEFVTDGGKAVAVRFGGVVFRR